MGYRFFTGLMRIGLLAGLLLISPGYSGRVEFSDRFAPHDGRLSEYERPLRQEICLNGLWQFQPVRIPEGYKDGSGIAPKLSAAVPQAWEQTPIKIPSAWNVNNWGLWGQAGTYDPVPLYYPSYPEAWKHVSMGWLRRTFRIPAEWNQHRLILHFDGVAGQCRVLVNGKTVIDSHYSTGVPFEADITEQVNWLEENELLVGILAQRLFNKRHPEHRWGWDAMGPRGSDLFDLCGIDQDVYLNAVPRVSIEDVFIKPWVERDELEIDVTVYNTTNKAETLLIGGEVRPWKSLAGKDVLSAPQARWMLEAGVLSMGGQSLRIGPNERKTITLKDSVKGRLKLWRPGQPNLYGLILNLDSDGRSMDRSYTRFGWRQFTIQDGDLWLNGEKIRLYGDILHPFSSFIMTRRTAWAWFTMIQDFGGNAVRPHAQPWPKFYIDMAEEMGIVVLDETGVFGSAGGFNMDEEQAWENCRQQYEALIRRDRNSPAVMGWSFANEMFALGALNKIPDEAYNVYRDKLAEFGKLASALDPTRPWISCDGDEDLGGRLGIWSKHWGDGWKDKKGIHYSLPEDASKPWMLGEYSGSYYGLPHRLDYLNGDRAYESYAGRVEALGIDIYELAVDIARDKLDYFSASETVWFGLEHLNFGYDDFSRLPTAQDGVFFTRPYREGEPGMQPERLPPFIATLNPGWDPKLPLYKPLAMFEAMKAALSPDAPLPYSGRVPFRKRPDVPMPTIKAVEFAGAADGELAAFLKKQQVRLASDAADSFLIIDAHTAALDAALKERTDAALSKGGTVLVMIGGPLDTEGLNRILPEPLQLTERQASSFVHSVEEGITAPFSFKELYFIDNEKMPPAMRCGLGGALTGHSKILLEACPIDWTLFNAPENRKCAALILSEKLQKPSGAALIEYAQKPGRLLVCSIDFTRTGEPFDRFWQKLFACLGVDTSGASESRPEASWPKAHDLLRDGPLQ
jgi:beta-galactosidase